jgi:hypothetical protein
MSCGNYYFGFTLNRKTYLTYANVDNCVPSNGFGPYMMETPCLYEYEDMNKIDNIENIKKKFEKLQIIDSSYIPTIKELADKKTTDVKSWINLWNNSCDLKYKACFKSGYFYDYKNINTSYPIHIWDLDKNKMISINNYKSYGI